MVYCKKCVRILDTDVDICPYCGERDENADENYSAFDWTDGFSETGDDDRKQAKARHENPKAEPPVYKEPHIVPPVKETPAVPKGGQADSALQVEPLTGTVEPYPQDTEQSESPSSGLYTVMILLSVFVGVAGVIVGIVYMTDKREAYRKMGLRMLLVSIGAIIVATVSCCGFLYWIGESV